MEGFGKIYCSFFLAMTNALSILVAVFVLARSRAESIPAVSEIFDYVVVQRPLADGKRRLRVHDEELDEERAGSPPHLDPQNLASFIRNGENSVDLLAPIPESSKLSLPKDKSIAKPSSATLNVPNKLDVSHLKSKKAFTQRMEELGINIDDVVAGVQSLRKQPEYLKYEAKRLFLMGFGSVYFDKLERSGIKFIPIQLHKLRDSEKFTNEEFQEFEQWALRCRHTAVATPKVYAKISWLKENGDFDMSIIELAEMAFGSELLSAYEILAPPKSETLDKLKHLIEQLTNRKDVDLKVKDKLRAFAEDPGLIGKNEEELLKGAKDAVFNDELSHLKSNKELTQRIEALGIDIDDVKDDVQMLRTTRGLLYYNDYSLALMTLGSKYFKQIESPATKFVPITQGTLAKTMGKYVKSKQFKDWKAHRYSSHVKFQEVYAKMLWLVKDEALRMKDEELADMAFGSEFFIYNKIDLNVERLKYRIKQLKERGGVRKEVIDELETILKQDPQSFVGKKAELLERKVKHEMLGADLEEETTQKKKRRVN